MPLKRQTTANGKCRAKTKAGRPCAAPAVRGTDLCALHADPGRAAELGRKGGARNRKVYDSEVRSVSVPESAGDVKRMLAETMADIRAERMDPKLDGQQMTSPVERVIVLPEANPGLPLKGDFERMARRRYQSPKPARRGEWWTLRVWKDTFTNGQKRRTRERVRLAPATMSAREAQKVADEYLRPLNQGLGVCRR